MGFTKKRLAALENIMASNLYDGYRAYKQGDLYLLTDGAIGVILTEKPDGIEFTESTAQSDKIFRQMEGEYNATRVIASTQYTIKELRNIIRKHKEWKKTLPNKGEGTHPIVKIAADPGLCEEYKIFGRNFIYVSARYLMWAIESLGTSATLYFGKADGYTWPTVMVSRDLTSREFSLVLPVNDRVLYGRELVMVGGEWVPVWDVEGKTNG